MQGPLAAYLDGGTRLHLQHGPIDLVIGADGDAPDARQRAFDAAGARFRTVLEELVAELPLLRARLRPDSEAPSGAVARRMHGASLPHSGSRLVTPMIAVAGSVADEILDAMCSAATLTRAYVNNGGDIAVRLEGGAAYSVAVSGPAGARLATLRFGAGSGIGGIATSGTGGRSLSFGIADSVTVVAGDAATADAAATLIANAVDLPGHAGIVREPADSLQPDSDLGPRPVVTRVPRLAGDEVAAALGGGRALADAMVGSGGILGAAMFLQGRSLVAGHPFPGTVEPMEAADA